MQKQNEQKNKKQQIPLFVELAQVMTYHQLPKLIEVFQTQQQLFYLYLDSPAADDKEERQSMLVSYTIVKQLLNLLKEYTPQEMNSQCLKIADYE